MLFHLKNITTGAFEVDFEVIGGAGAILVLDRGYSYWIWCDGADIIDLTRELLDHATDVTTTYQATANDRKINGDTVGGAFTITLPQAVPGKELLITSVGAVTALTIARGGADTMNGSASNLTISTQWQGIKFVGETATNWIAHRLTVA